MPTCCQLPAPPQISAGAKSLQCPVTAVIRNAATLCSRQSHNVGLSTTGRARDATTTNADELLKRLMAILLLATDTNLTIRLSPKAITISGSTNLYAAAQTRHDAWLTKWSATRELEIAIP